MKRIEIEIDGPVLRSGKKSCAWVRVKRNRVTSDVRWDAGSIDNEEVASEGFGRRLLEMGMFEELMGFGNRLERGWWSGSVRWGGARLITHKQADELAGIVAGYFLEAAKDLPVDRYEHR